MNGIKTLSVYCLLGGTMALAHLYRVAPKQTTRVVTKIIPRMGDCPQGGDHQWVAEKTGVGIIYTCQKCNAGK